MKKGVYDIDPKKRSGASLFEWSRRRFF